MCWCRLASGRWILCRRTEWERHVGCLESRHVYTVSTLCLDIFWTVRLLFVAEERACWDLSPKVGSMASAARSSCSHGAMVPWCHGNHRTALRSRLRDAKESRGGLGRMMQARTDKSLPLLCHCMLQLFTLSLSYSSEAVFDLFGMHLMAGNFRALSASERKHVNASVVAAQGCTRLHNIRQSVSWIFGCRRI